MLSKLLPLLILSSPAARPAEPPEIIAQRGAAEALERRKAYVAAGDAYFKLAAIPGVARRDAFDKSRENYDSDYMLTRSPRSLCWALGISELVVQEGGFADDNEAEYWRDNVRDDLGRLRTDAQTTGRPNCRFDGSGASLRPQVALLTDDAFRTDRSPPAPRPSPVRDSRRGYTLAGGVFTGVGLGLVGGMIGAIAVQGARTQALRSMTRQVMDEDREFTETEAAYARRLGHEGLQAQRVAIGVGIAGALTVTTGAVLLATRKRQSRRFAFHPYGGLTGAGAVLHVRF